MISHSELYHAKEATAGYDSLNQLAAFSRGKLSDATRGGIPDTIASPSRSQSWTPDGQGNFTTVTTNGAEETRTYDKQNQVTALIDASGNVVERYVYDPYGKVTILSPDGSTVRTSSSFGWTYLHQGGRQDTATGLLNFRNRDYSTSLMRWTTNDPIGFAGGDTNTYRYVGNGPGNGLDPSGLIMAPHIPNNEGGDSGKKTSDFNWEGVDLNSSQYSWGKLPEGFTPRKISYWDNLTWYNPKYYWNLGGAALEGGIHGWAMWVNEFTFHNIDSPNNYVENIIEENKGWYRFAYYSNRVSAYACWAIVGCKSFNFNYKLVNFGTKLSGTGAAAGVAGPQKCLEKANELAQKYNGKITDMLQELNACNFSQPQVQEIIIQYLYKEGKFIGEVIKFKDGCIMLLPKMDGKNAPIVVIDKLGKAISKIGDFYCSKQVDGQTVVTNLRDRMAN